MDLFKTRPVNHPSNPLQKIISSMELALGKVKNLPSPKADIECHLKHSEKVIKAAEEEVLNTAAEMQKEIEALQVLVNVLCEKCLELENQLKS